MYSRFTIQTRHSTLEAQAILQSLIRPRRSLFAANPTSPDARPFQGEVDKGAFKFLRVITGRNSFLPIVVGRVEQEEGGAVVRGHMRMAVPVMVFMAVWMGGAITAAVQQVPRCLRAGDIWEAIAIACFPLFGLVMVVVGY